MIKKKKKNLNNFLKISAANIFCNFLPNFLKKCRKPFCFYKIFRIYGKLFQNYSQILPIFLKKVLVFFHDSSITFSKLLNKFFKSLQNFLSYTKFPPKCLENFSKNFPFFLKNFLQCYKIMFTYFLKYYFLKFFKNYAKLSAKFQHSFPKTILKFYQNIRIFLSLPQCSCIVLFQNFSKINSKLPCNFSKAPSWKWKIFPKFHINLLVTSTK